MNIYEIVKKYLEDNNLKGLFNSDIECGCSVDDLMPCCEPNENCEVATTICENPKCNSDCDFAFCNKDPKTCEYMTNID